MVYLPLCCNWHCQRTLKLIETDLSLITEAAGVRKVDDRLVLSLSLSLPPSLLLFPMLFSLSAVTLSLSLCLRAMVGGSGGQLEEWQPLPGSALTVPIWCAATESYVPHLPRPPSSSLSLSSYLPQKKLCVLMVFWCKPWRGKMVFPLLLPASPSATGAAPPPAACLSQRAVKLAREEALASANYVLIIGNVLANQGLELPFSALRKGGVCVRVLKWIEEERRTESGSKNRPSKHWAKS